MPTADDPSTMRTSSLQGSTLSTVGTGPLIPLLCFRTAFVTVLLVRDSLLRGDALTVRADSVDVHGIESRRSQKRSGQRRSPA